MEIQIISILWLKQWWVLAELEMSVLEAPHMILDLLQAQFTMVHGWLK